MRVPSRFVLLGTEMAQSPVMVSFSVWSVRMVLEEEWRERVQMREENGQWQTSSGSNIKVAELTKGWRKTFWDLQAGIFRKCKGWMRRAAGTYALTMAWLMVWSVARVFGVEWQEGNHWRTVENQEDACLPSWTWRRWDHYVVVGMSLRGARLPWGSQKVLEFREEVEGHRGYTINRRKVQKAGRVSKELAESSTVQSCGICSLW